MGNSEQVVSDCADLTPGERVSVWRDGRLCHAGTVTDLLPDMGLFWIREEPLFERRLLDLSEVRVTRTVKPGRQEPETAGPAFTPAPPSCETSRPMQSDSNTTEAAVLEELGPSTNQSLSLPAISTA